MPGSDVKIRIGHYVLGHTIGQGSFGKVKLAEHELTGHKVAVKILNRQKIASHKQIDKKIKREIRILKLLRHPHIIRLYEVIETPTDIFVIMEYVSGGELFDYIVKNGRLSQPNARRFFQQIICAVEHCHFYRVVHRDLKPENLLLDDQKNVRVADFGLSNLHEDGDFLRTSCGSPNYAAPEVVSGKLYAGPEVDVWSCGVILYAFLCGRLPFDEESIPLLFKKIREGSYFLPQHLGEDCADLIKRLLEVDPLKRITIPEVRAHRWFVEGLPPYLQPKPHLQAEEDSIDADILEIIVKKMEIPYEIGSKALLSGTKNDISISYFILLDAKRKAQRASDSTNFPVSRSEPKSTKLDTNQCKPLVPSPVMESLLTMGSEQSKTQYNEPATGFAPSSSPSRSNGMDSFLSPGYRPDLDPLGGLAPKSAAVKMPGQVSEPIAMPGKKLDSPDISYDDTPGWSFKMSLIEKMGLRRLRMNDEELGQGLGATHGLMQENWRLGIYTQLSSNDAMSHIYAVLTQAGIVWKTMAPYQLKCIARPPNQDPVRVSIQLYRMNERHDKGYLVDLAILENETFPAIDTIHSLYIKLCQSMGA